MIKYFGRFVALALLFCLSTRTFSADLSPAARASLVQLVSTGEYTRGLPEFVKPGSGSSVFFLQSGPTDTARSLYELDTSTGITRKLVGPSALGASPEGLYGFQPSEDGKQVLVPYFGHIFLVRLADNRLLSFSGEGYSDPVLSPNGKYIAAVKANNLFVISVTNGNSRQLTRSSSASLTYGSSDLVDSEEFGRKSGFWWSPDSRFIAVVQTDLSGVKSLSVPTVDDEQNGSSDLRYPLAGKSNAVVRLGVLNISNGRMIWAKYSYDEYPYLVRVVWQSLEAPLSLVTLSRDQHSELLTTIDPLSGAGHTLVSEHDPDWIDVAPDFAHLGDDHSPYWLSDGSGFLWLSSENGDWQIEIRDSSGRLVRNATPVGLHVRSIDDVNESAGTITFEADSDARQCQIYQTDFRGGLIKPLTHSVGLHRAVFSFDHRMYADSYSLANGETGTDVFSSDTGFRLARLPSLATTPLAVPVVKYLRVGTLIPLDTAVVYPDDFKAGTEYPAILRVNGSIGANLVTTGISSYLDAQWYADRGYIVVFVDGRGTPDRGKMNETAIKDDIVGQPLSDQVNALIELAKAVPEIDLTHVTIVGQGVGGSLAEIATARRPEIFASGVAISPISNWRYVDTALAERYLGVPSVDPGGYRVSSPMTYTSDLQRPLLIIQPTTVSDYSLATSLKFSETLVQEEKSVQFVPLNPGSSTSSEVAEHEVIAKFLAEQNSR